MLQEVRQAALVFGLIERACINAQSQRGCLLWRVIRHDDVAHPICQLAILYRCIRAKVACIMRPVDFIPVNILRSAGLAGRGCAVRCAGLIAAAGGEQCHR